MVRVRGGIPTHVSGQRPGNRAVARDGVDIESNTESRCGTRFPGCLHTPQASTADAKMVKPDQASQFRWRVAQTRCDQTRGVARSRPLGRCGSPSLSVTRSQLRAMCTTTPSRTKFVRPLNPCDELVRSQPAAEAARVDPECWWQSQGLGEPRYDILLERLAPSVAARRDLLHAYFEPADTAEREAGIKRPTAAHRAIAELVSVGRVRLIPDHQLRSSDGDRSGRSRRASTGDLAAGGDGWNGSVAARPRNGDQAARRLPRRPVNPEQSR